MHTCITRSPIIHASITNHQISAPVSGLGHQVSAPGRGPQVNKFEQVCGLDHQMSVMGVTRGSLFEMGAEIGARGSLWWVPMHHRQLSHGDPYWHWYLVATAEAQCKGTSHIQTDWQTHMTENITFPQLYWQMVKINIHRFRKFWIMYQWS